MLNGTCPRWGIAGAMFAKLQSKHTGWQTLCLQQTVTCSWRPPICTTLAMPLNLCRPGFIPLMALGGYGIRVSADAWRG